MAKKQNNVVTLKVHKSFFDNIFEPERKRLQSQFGMLNFSQTKFTEYLDKSRIKIKYPKKMNMPKLKSKKIGGVLNLRI